MKITFSGFRQLKLDIDKLVTAMKCTGKQTGRLY